MQTRQSPRLLTRDIRDKQAYAPATLETRPHRAMRSALRRMPRTVFFGLLPFRLRSWNTPLYPAAVRTGAKCPLQTTLRKSRGRYTFEIHQRFDLAGADRLLLLHTAAYANARWNWRGRG